MVLCFVLSAGVPYVMQRIALLVKFVLLFSELKRECLKTEALKTLLLKRYC